MESELSSRPSFFEVYASQHLNGTLRPAVRFLLEVLSVRNPRLITASAWSDEIFSAVLLVLEISQLRKGSALLAESFYSLRRSVNSSFKPNLTLQKPLSGSQVICSVFFAVLVPYVKAKLDNWYENATGGAAAALFPDQLPPDSDHSADSPYQPFLQSLSIHNHSERSSFLHHLLQSPQLLAKLVTALQRYLKNPSLRKRALALYPHICLVFEGINLLFSILYLYDFSNYFTLPLALQRLVLRRVGAHDLLGIVSLTTNGAQMQLNTGAWNIWSTVTEKLLDLLKAAFFASIFGFRFLQYYYATEASTPRETGPIMPPPEPLEPANGVDPVVARASGKCPLCGQVRTNPTACSSSGYVYCYLCIVNHLQHTQRCPVSFAPTTMENLIRVYDEANAT